MSYQESPIPLRDALTATTSACLEMAARRCAR